MNNQRAISTVSGMSNTHMMEQSSKISTGTNCYIYPAVQSINKVDISPTKVENVIVNHNQNDKTQLGCLSKISGVSTPYGRLKLSLSKWKNTLANKGILDIISNGYKLPLSKIPSNAIIKNNASARNNSEFVSKEIQKLSNLGCISQIDHIPKVVNPLTVAINGSKKQRLVLDGRHVNDNLHSFKFKMEDTTLARVMFKQGDFGFRFDLKSAYHHINMFPAHREYLGFYWDSKYYTFNVLPFGLSTAAFVFTKVLRHLVLHWRSQGIRVILYLDDGIAVADTLDEASKFSSQIKQDLLDFGFLIAEEKSEWKPCERVLWLGHIFDFKTNIVKLSDCRLHSIESCITNLLQASKCSGGKVTARRLASVVGSIQSASGAVGNIAKFHTKFCHMCIQSMYYNSWDSVIFLTDKAKHELNFWIQNLKALNGQKFVLDYVYELIAFSDASDTGYGGYIMHDGNVDQISSGTWKDSESKESSTWRELAAIGRLLPEFAEALRGRVVQWNVDNKNVVFILRGGSMKPVLQEMAVLISQMLMTYSISLIPVWIPRELNTLADELSRDVPDNDDWQITIDMFRFLTDKWGMCTVDRFASSHNAKCRRFNSKVLMCGTKAVDSMSIHWGQEMNWVVPPPKIAAAVIRKMIAEMASCILVVPKWESAPYWPMLMYTNFVADQFDFRKKNEHVCPGNGRNGIFTDERVSFLMSAFLISF